MASVSNFILRMKMKFGKLQDFTKLDGGIWENLFNI